MRGMLIVAVLFHGGCIAWQAIPPDSHSCDFPPGSGDLSPDRRFLVYTLQRDSSSDLILVDLESKEESRLTDTPYRECSPRYSPDGSKIVYLAEADGDGYGEVYILDLEASVSTRVTNNSSADYRPQFSPDGARIMFESSRQLDTMEELYYINCTEDCEFITVCDVPTLKCKDIVTVDQDFVHAIGWDQAQEQIYFTRSKRKKESTELWAISTVSGERVRLMTYDEMEQQGLLGLWGGALSPDGDRFVIAREGTLFAARIDGMEAEEITMVSTPIASPRFTWDREGVFFTTTLGEDGVQFWVVNLDGTGLTSVAVFPPSRPTNRPDRPGLTTDSLRDLRN